MAFKFKVEGAQEAWEAEFGHLHAGGVKTAPVPELTEFARKLAVVEGPERGRGIGIWRDSGADTGDFVEFTWKYRGVSRTRQALLRVCISGGIPVGLYMQNLIIRFEELEGLKIIKPAGTFYMGELPPDALKGYKTWVELTERMKAREGN